MQRLHIATGAVLGAPMIQEVVLVDDQFQIDEAGDWDNLRIVPEPAGLALFGMALAGLLRRRRGTRDAA